MKLGSTQTILSALSRSIEKANPGIAVALVCPDRRSGKLTYFMAPSSPGRFSPSRLRLQYLIEGLDSENSACANGTENLWRSGQLGSDAGGSGLWTSGTLNFSVEHDFGLLAVCQSPESLPPALDLDSVQSAMTLAIRKFWTAERPNATSVFSGTSSVYSPCELGLGVCSRKAKSQLLDLGKR